MIRLLKSPEIAAAVAIVGPIFGALIGGAIGAALLGGMFASPAGAGAIIGAGAVTAGLAIVGTFSS